MACARPYTRSVHHTTDYRMSCLEVSFRPEHLYRAEHPALSTPEGPLIYSSVMESKVRNSFSWIVDTMISSIIHEQHP